MKFPSIHAFPAMCFYITRVGQCCIIIVFILYSFSYSQASVYKPDLSPMMDIEMTLMSIELVYLWSALPMTSEATKLKMLEMLHKATSPNGLPFHHGLRDLLMGCVLKSLNRIPEAEKVCGM